MEFYWEKTYFLFHFTEWVCFFYIENRGNALVNPVSYLRPDHFSSWDTVRLGDYENSGEYMLCNKQGKGLNWLDVEDGMIVKIKAKNVNYPGNVFLQPNYNLLPHPNCNCFSRVHN